LQDPHVQELLLKETSNDKAAAREKDKLEQMEKDGKTLLYPGCQPGDTCLNVTLKALEMKVQHKWTDVSFDDNLEYWYEKLPERNTLPRSTEEAKKVMCPLDLLHVKYDASINDCALYRDEYKELTTCPVCGQSRYKRGNRKVPQKVVWYFPITTRLKRYFVDPKEVKLMQWHAEREKPRDDPEKGTILTHPAEASQWLALDMEDGFEDDARNVRLGMSTDGLNPFSNQSSKHSTWPVFVWPYNLPPYSIQYLEEHLLQEKNPGYPVYTIKVPEGHGFVDTSSAKIFFVWYEDIYNLLHSNCLDYNLVRLYTLHMALKAKRKKTKGIVIVDPYFMRDVALVNEADQATVKEYLGNIFVENPTIDSILLPCFSE
jgi:hypothetical protein